MELTGESFYVCVTEEARTWSLFPEKRNLRRSDQGTSSGEFDDDEDYIRYVAPVSKPWVCLGSDVEMEEEKVHETRDKVRSNVK